MTQIICFPLVSRNSPHNHFSLLTVLEAMDKQEFLSPEYIYHSSPDLWWHILWPKS